MENKGIFYTFFEIWSNRTMNWSEKLGILKDLERELKEEAIE